MLKTDKSKTPNDKIISAVENLIAEKGVNDFSLKDVAEAMHISKGTLYYHYASKDELILDLMEKHIRELEEDYDAWLARHKNDIITKERFLDVIFYKGVKLFNKAKIHVYLINECMRGNPSLKEKYNSLWKEWQDKLQDGLKQVFPDVQDGKTFAYMLMLIIDGLTIQEVLEAKPENDQKLISAIENMKGI
jgi:AcrR family transcriptional regulator